MNLTSQWLFKSDRTLNLRKLKSDSKLDLPSKKSKVMNSIFLSDTMKKILLALFF